jgi:hypothetical protein
MIVAVVEARHEREGYPSAHSSLTDSPTAHAGFRPCWWRVRAAATDRAPRPRTTPGSWAVVAVSSPPVAAARMRGAAAQAELRAPKVRQASAPLVPTSVAGIETAATSMTPVSRPVGLARVALAFGLRHRAHQIATARVTGRLRFASLLWDASVRLVPRSAVQGARILWTAVPAKHALADIASRQLVRTTRIARLTSSAPVVPVAARHAARMPTATATA